MSLPLALLLAGAASAQPLSTAPIAGASYERRNVFDLSVPEDDLWAFRWANRIHMVTQEQVLRRELLLAPGEPYDALKALETERNLRALGFLRDASVTPVARPDGTVDVAVRTQDSWTLTPRASLATEGGQTTLVYGVSEGNLLGLGKQVSFFNSSQSTHRRTEVRYGDPRFLRTDARVLGHFADTDRGGEYGLRLARPFFAHDTPWSAETTWARVAQDEARYASGVTATEFQHDYRAARGLAAVRLFERAETVHRLGAGWRWEHSRFSPLTTTVGGVPAERQMTGPLAAYALIEPKYIKATDLDRVRVVEDFNLGWELGVEGGPLLEALGSDHDRWGMAASLQKGLGLGPGRFALVQAVADSRAADNGRIENGVLTGSMNLFWRTPFRFRQTLVAHAEYTTVKSLDGERQLNVGGDSGLRGYKNNAFQGARAAIVNLEDRAFFDANILRLVHVGAVGFLDAGSAIPQGNPFGRAAWKVDLGAGLRLSSSRSSSGGVLRLDVAYALNGGPGGSRWVVSLKGGQAFSLAGSANRPLLRRPDAILADDSPSERLRRR
ncbi:hypothetical protein EPO15_10025 [bacterium]|nr:MAG: hypothetical protein EPO15_10025 [bacterium]